MSAFDFCPTSASHAVEPEIDYSGRPCPSDFEGATTNDEDGNVLGLCFKVLPTSLASWHLCNAHCKSLGVNATLPVFRHEKEAVFANHVFDRHRLKRPMLQAYWLGISDLEHEGNFTWMDGRSLQNTSLPSFIDFEDFDNLRGWTGNGECGADCVSLEHDVSAKGARIVLNVVGGGGGVVIIQRALLTQRT